MWKSIGDKYEIKTCNNDDSPRKMRTNGYTIILLILMLIVSRYSFDSYIINGWESIDALRIIKICIYSITAITSLALLILKYINNHKELDLLLSATLILSAYMLLSVNADMINYANYMLK